MVLLHGYGADGNDLIGLAPEWQPLLPDAEFISPNAPFPCEAAPFGNGSAFKAATRAQGVGRRGSTAAAILDQYLTELLAERRHR